jgi:hypothetical protein
VYIDKSGDTELDLVLEHHCHHSSASHSTISVCLLPAGVYIDKSGDTELDHDVEVVGWGEEEDGTKYWLVSIFHLPRPYSNM